MFGQSQRRAANPRSAQASDHMNSVVPPSVIALRLPFMGTWFVAQGGDTMNVNHHMAIESQWFGIDFARVGGIHGRELADGVPHKLEDCYSWGETVVSPCQGQVERVEDGHPDNAIGTSDPSHPAGNYIVIKVKPDVFIFIAHFQHSSIAVQPGFQVATGQVLGLCGNSGNSTFPHVHLHVQNTPEYAAGTGQPFEFEGMDVELCGRTFSNVSWPLIRGLFVRQHAA